MIESLHLQKQVPMESSQEEKIIETTAAYVRQELAGAESGHDWFHIYRVWQSARAIAEGESARLPEPADGSESRVNLLVVELGALLHDIADAKFHNGDETIGPLKARLFLETLDLPADIIAQVVTIVQHISFKGGNHFKGAPSADFYTPELGIVQDADRLDAIGAIGIARAFNYGGFKNRAIYDPAIAPALDMTKEQYKQSTAPTINHFYEKLLLLKDKMNTATGKAIACERHLFMERFLEQFYAEWDGKA